jgi:predicted oxidoreductase
VTIQTWSPFQYGFFEGIFIDNEKFPELNEALERIGRKYGISKSALAVAWILRHPAQMQVIVGTTNAGRLQDICTASGVKISRGDWYEIYQAAGKKVL